MIIWGGDSWEDSRGDCSSAQSFLGQENVLKLDGALALNIAKPVQVHTGWVHHVMCESCPKDIFKGSAMP